MIRINLLPREDRRSDIPYARVASFFILIFIVLLGSIYGVIAAVNWSAQRDLAAAQARYDELLPVRQAMEQAGDKQKQIDAKQVLVNQLEKSRISPYNLLTRIAAALPPNVWLDETKVNQSDASMLELKGEVGAYPELAQFIKRLEADKAFSAVTLKDTDVDQKAGLWKYTLELKLKGM